MFLASCPVYFLVDAHFFAGLSAGLLDIGSRIQGHTVLPFVAVRLVIAWNSEGGMEFLLFFVPTVSSTSYKSIGACRS